MFRGYNKPTRNQIFGPSAIGGTINDIREHQIYQHGEGIGSFFSSLFRKFLPAAAKTVKKIASSDIVKDTGKQLVDSAITGLTNIAADAIAGKKNINESVSDELANARNEISTALKKANNNRKSVFSEDSAPNLKKRKKSGKKVVVKYKKKRRKRSVFDEYE